jgi:hypothetical protein
MVFLHLFDNRVARVSDCSCYHCTAAITLLLPAILGVIPDVPLGDDADFPTILVLKFLLSLSFLRNIT